MEKCELCGGLGYICESSESRYHKYDYITCRLCCGSSLKNVDLNLVEYKQPFPLAKD